MSNWLKDKGISVPPKAFRAELWTPAKQHRDIHAQKIIDEIAKTFRHEVLTLPPYHCEQTRKILLQKKTPLAIWKLSKSCFERGNQSLQANFVEDVSNTSKELKKNTLKQTESWI